MSEPMETAPALELTPQALDHLVEAWREYHAIDSPLLQRREPREAASSDLPGLVLERPRQASEPMGLALEGANAKAVRTLPWCSSDGAWDADVLLTRHGQEVATYLGDEDGVLTLDGRDFLPQGRESVGVTRQDCGAVGTRATGHAGVVVGDVSHRGSTLLARRLSMPPEGLEEAA
jgi:SRSO17 transposase